VLIDKTFNGPKQDGFFSHLPSAKHEIFSVGLPEGNANPA